MLRDGVGEHDLLQVLALQHQTLWRVLMRDARHILFDDRTGIQLSRHIVRRGTDDLHTALVGLMVGFRTDECRQERVVDVDDVVRVLGDHLVGDNLHIARQHDKRDVLLLQQ